eukprot:m.14335 g.14335  ORF g.14335 m.14335 type:complete len:482 (-) comp22175_c0_seq1:618-2063(-)
MSKEQCTTQRSMNKVKADERIKEEQDEKTKRGSSSRVRPPENGAVSADTDNVLLCCADLDVGDFATLATADGEDFSLLVLPHLDQLVLTARHNQLAVGRHVKSVERANRARQLADETAVVNVPGGNLLVGAARDDLRLVRYVCDLCEERSCEDNLAAHKLDEIPHDTRAIRAGAHTSLAACFQLDARYMRLVLFQAFDECLRLWANLPDSNETIPAAAHNLRAIGCCCNSGHPLVVRVVDLILQLARLWKEGSDLAIVPAGDDGFTVGHEAQREALLVRHGDAEHFLVRRRMPDAHIFGRACGKEIRGPRCKLDLVDLRGVRNLAQLGRKVCDCDTVDFGATGPNKNLMAIATKGHRRNPTLELGGLDDLPSTGLHHRYCSIAGPDNQIASLRVGKRNDTQGVLGLLWKRPLEEFCAEGNLHDIARSRPTVSELVIWRDDDALCVAADGAKLAVSHVQLHGGLVELPDTQDSLTTRDELVV